MGAGAALRHTQHRRRTQHMRNSQYVERARRKAKALAEPRSIRGIRSRCTRLGVGVSGCSGPATLGPARPKWVRMVAYAAAYAAYAA